MNIIKPTQGNFREANGLTKKNNPIKKSPSLYSLSFKAAPATLITQADKKIIDVFSQHYGDVAERVGTKLGKLVTTSPTLKNSARFQLEKGILSIKDKKIGQSIVENAVFPFVNIPLYGASWVLKKAQAIPGLQKGAKKIYSKPLFRIPRKLNELDSKTDIMKGIYEKTQSTVSKFAAQKGINTEYLLKQLNKADDTPQAKNLVKEANEYIKENLYKVSNKFFDKHTGNFNTAYERPLNRIVSGLIPVAFLANDAYNLSVLCGDDKQTSKKEAQERRKQEISRVFSTAYIQLLTFGAFTKQVNTIPWFTPLTSAATVLFSEVSSRRKLKKPIFFLSKEKAKEYNKNKDINNNETAKINANKLTNQNVPKMSSYPLTHSESKIFASFKAAAPENKSNISNKNETKKEEQPKALINFKTFKKAIGILIAAGFTLSFIKNSSYTKNSKPVKAIQNLGKTIKTKLYDPIAFKDFEISQSKFEEITKSLKDAGCKEIAEGHEFIKNKYGKKTADGIIKMYKSSLSSSKVPEVIDSVISQIKNKNNSISKSDCEQIAKSIKTAINSESTSIAENKIQNVTQKAIEIINNKKINIDKIDDLSNIITKTLSENITESAIQIETKAKPFVDIITQPFKFIMSALRLPFKISKSAIQLVLSPIKKKAAKEALGQAELSKFESAINKAVVEIFGESKASGGKISQTIFANAMEQLEKQTLPYRNAEAALKNIIKNNGSQQEINKAKDAVEKAAEKLKIYVNTAVEKSFNGVTQSSNKNTDLAIMAKLASSAVTSAFLVADNYNMVMLKSDGEDTEGAKEKANERIIQRLSALFYQTLFINWFNATFRSTYNSSLKGMTAVVIPNTLTTEIVTRKSIGMPVGKKSYEELQEIDEKNENRTGFAGKYFKFMRLLTGKKPLKDRLPKNKQTENSTSNSNNHIQSLTESLKKGTTTNLLELYSK